MNDVQSDYLPISALQHLAYCPRQFALIHLQREWQDNRYTAEGHVMHQRANSGASETRGELHIARSLPLESHRLRLVGVADVVEFRRTDSCDRGIAVPGLQGLWLPYPVEYKRGRSKTADWDRIQLCTQAMCLEEMLDTVVPEGALYYGQTRRREIVTLDTSLRQQTETLADQLYEVWSSRRMPAPVAGPKCERCSLRERCVPKGGDARAYLDRVLKN